MWRRGHLLPFLISVAIVASSLYAYRKHFAFFEQFELKTIDMRFHARDVLKPGKSVVLAVIDEKSIDREGKWVWPRRKIAKLVDRLSEEGAAVIAFDIGFVDPDDRGELFTLKSIARKVADLGISDENLMTFINSLIKRADNDAILADAIRRSRAPVVLGYFFQMTPEQTAHTSVKQREIQSESIFGSEFDRIHFQSEKAFNVDLYTADLPEANIPKIANAASYSGFFNMFPDSDGVIRRIPGVIRYEDYLYAHLSLKALSAYLNAPLEIDVSDYGVSRMSVGERNIPVDEYGRIMVNYRGGAYTFEHISVTDILNKKIDPARIKGKIVLVGVTAVGIYDLRVTPFDKIFPGVEVHANLIDSVLSGDILYKPVWADILEIVIMVFSGVFLGLLIPRIRPLAGALLAASGITVYIFFCQYLFSAHCQVLGMVFPVFVMMFTYLVLSLYRFLVEDRQKRFIKNAFATYLSPAVVNQLIESPEKLVLGGEKREITAFFSDVEGFTTISEKLGPEALVELLNDFLTEMTDIILEHAGMVDKFEGDAIIAMFGAPNELPKHAEAACLAAVAMQERLDVLRPSWEESKGVTIRMRVGLFSGPAVVGNMGSRNRMDYTMMGDTVNTASRLEGVNKFYGTYVMIGQTTYEAAKHAVFAREIDSINVVGKTIPVKIYELMGRAGSVDKTIEKMVEMYEKGLQLYREREFEKALEFFEQGLELVPDDRPSAVMRDRCKEYMQNPPPDNWNGAFVMRTK